MYDVFSLLKTRWLVARWAASLKSLTVSSQKIPIVFSYIRESLSLLLPANSLLFKIFLRRLCIVQIPETKYMLLLLAANQACKECEVGSCAPNTSCSSCSLGHYQNASGQTLCLPCQAGSYQDMLGQASCKPCDVGHYQDKTGQKSCLPCPKGSSQHSRSQKGCVKCDLGHFQDAAGKNACSPCPQGSFQNQTGQTSCIKCSAGSAEQSFGQANCTPCSPGYFTKYVHLWVSVELLNIPITTEIIQSSFFQTQHWPTKSQ